MKRFATSDSHGGYKALVQCLDSCGFDKEKDQLFFLGDVVDGWSQTKESIELLLSVKNLVFLLGNHDEWALEYYTGKLKSDELALESWLRQGGAATIASYGKSNPLPQTHLELLQKAKLYHITEDNILFVHAGFDPSKPIEKTSAKTLLWSRDFIEQHYDLYLHHKLAAIRQYNEVYIGHTPTIALDREQTTPLQMANLTLIDTGAAFTECLSILDIDSKEVWQSDKLMTLYPDEKGRNHYSWHELLKTDGSLLL